MADSGQLLRLLEPAVRPVPQTPQGGGSASNTAPTAPSFEQQLATARQTAASDAHASDGTTGSAETSQTNEPAPELTSNPTNELASLSSIDRVENPTLRHLIENEQNGKNGQS